MGTGTEIAHGNEARCITNMEDSCESNQGTASNEGFSKLKVDELKTYLRERGIQLSDAGRGKRKAELLDLCEKAAAMKQRKLDDSAEDLTKVIDDKLQTAVGKLPDPKSLNGWTYNFAKVPEFTFGDLYSYLVGKEDYSAENLRSFKSLLGFKLFHDGHVVDMKFCPLEEKKFCFFKFKVKPTERTKTENGEATYDGFVILKSSGEVHAGFCPCKGGSDGYCRHVAAVLFDLQSTVANNLMTTCTSGKCQWKKRSGNSEYAARLQDLKFVKAEFGKAEKEVVKPYYFEPGCSSFDPISLREKLRRGLQEVYPQSVALQFLPKPKEVEIPEALVAAHIENDDNVQRHETVENVTVYSMKELTNLFKCENNIGSDVHCSDEIVQSFLNFLSIDEKQSDIICSKTVSQGNSQFWFDQRAGRITASNFYKVCHIRETTDKTNTVKLLMNYCPMEHVPEQLEWGHEKEVSATELYLKKISGKHKEVNIVESGIVINPKWPFLGASPDRIRYCKCHGKTLVECKSLFSKRNLLPGIAASEKLVKTTKGFKLKEKTSWYYQIQGQMFITGVRHTDLVIYTNKGILVVPVKFNEEFCLQMVKKLQVFFKNFMVPELLTGNILRTLSE